MSLRMEIPQPLGSLFLSHGHWAVFLSLNLCVEILIFLNNFYKCKKNVVLKVMEKKATVMIYFYSK